MNHPTPHPQLLFLELPARVEEGGSGAGLGERRGGGAWPGRRGAGRAGGCALIGGGAGFRRRVF